MREHVLACCALTTNNDEEKKTKERKQSIVKCWTQSLPNYVYLIHEHKKSKRYDSIWFQEEYCCEIRKEKAIFSLE